MKKSLVIMMIFLLVLALTVMFGEDCCCGEHCTVNVSHCALVDLIEYNVEGDEAEEGHQVDDWYRLPCLPQCPIWSHLWISTTNLCVIPGDMEIDPGNIPQMIEDGNLCTYYKDGFYYLMGNHTEFRIACNYEPGLKLEVPDVLTHESDSSKTIKVVHVELLKNHLITGGDLIHTGWFQWEWEHEVIYGPSGKKGPILPDPSNPDIIHVENAYSGCLLYGPGDVFDICHLGCAEDNRYGLYVVIKVPEDWTQLMGGEYNGTMYLTVTDS